MLPLLFNQQNEAAAAETVGRVHLFLCWPNPLKYGDELIGV